MSISAIKEPLNYYGYTLKPKPNNLVKVKDSTPYAKLIWEYFYDDIEVAKFLSNGSELTEELLREWEPTITTLDESFKNKKFWQSKYDFKNLKTAFDDYHEKETTTLNENAEALIKNQLVQEIEPIEQDKLDYLKQLSVVELKELCETLEIKKTGNKADLINSIAPNIPTKSIPKTLVFKPEYKEHLTKIALVYAQEAAKALSTLPASIDLKANLIYDLGEISAFTELEQVKNIVQNHQKFCDNKKTKNIPKQTLKTSEKTAIESLIFGSVIVGLLLYLLPGMPWYVYLIFWVVGTGTYYSKATEIKANEKMGDK